MALFTTIAPTIRWGLILIVIILLLSMMSSIYTPSVAPVLPLFSNIDNSNDIENKNISKSNAQKALIKATKEAEIARAAAKSKKSIAIATEAEEIALAEAENAIALANKSTNVKDQTEAIDDAECARAKVILAKCESERAKAIEKAEKTKAVAQERKELAKQAIEEKEKADIDAKSAEDALIEAEAKSYSAAKKVKVANQQQKHRISQNQLVQAQQVNNIHLTKQSSTQGSSNLASCNTFNNDQHGCFKQSHCGVCINDNNVSSCKPVSSNPNCDKGFFETKAAQEQYLRGLISSQDR